jgi:outer membrane protein OmpA-like peptidoglycan-associated protein
MNQMKTIKPFSIASILVVGLIASQVRILEAQDRLPREKTPFSYHKSPDYRQSESHPLRIAAYLLHPVGWVVREVVTRPLSYFASSTSTTRSITGYREPFDFREPVCFSAEDDAPDCRTISPFNQSSFGSKKTAENDGFDEDGIGRRKVAFDHVNFDFDKSTLNDRGKKQVAKIAEELKSKQDEDGSLALVLEGHTDEVGTEEYNMVLGKKRAETVKTELALLGIDQSRMKTVSLGETQPFETGNSPEAHAANRRVEVHID